MLTFPKEESSKNWPEDYPDGENKYINKCSICNDTFYGYKRRVVCKECHVPEGKLLKPKPQFYAICFGALQEIAKLKGYNLIMHGSFNRDMDLVAIPWINNPRPEVELIQSFDMHLRGVKYDDEFAELGYHFSVLPGGRHSYVIHLNRGGYWNMHQDEQYYLDISITPLPQ